MTESNSHRSNVFDNETASSIDMARYLQSSKLTVQPYERGMTDIWPLRNTSFTLNAIDKQHGGSGPTEPSSTSVSRISLNPTKGSDELIPKSICSQINRNKKCEGFREFLRLKDYGLQMPTNMHGLAPSQLKDLNLTNKWDRDYEQSGGYNYYAYPFLERNGKVDSTLVKLKNCQTSYINANFVGYKPANRSYILSQGPLSNTISHYWNMVWRDNVRSIIILNKLVEKGRSKCFQFFTMECTMEKILIDGLTEEDTAIMRLNDIDMTVELQSGIHYDSFVERILKILKSNTGETRDIHHYNYTDWPDFGEPSCPENFLRFLSILRSQHVFEHSPVIHCSAGSGRSGTFAFVDIVLTLLAASEGCNSHAQLMNILHNLRNERPGLIQTPEQLRFCFLSIIRAFCDVNMKINPKWVSEFIDFMEEDSYMNLKSAAALLRENRKN
ncbi:hypothetical protein GJ496_008283 [Pomphorhynchus laevis]|nr:hypothetical protein GJ496_008283 [Pomphorhynchus laevis]